MTERQPGADTIVQIATVDDLWVHLAGTANAGEQWFLLIDLSAGELFPHDRTGRIDVTQYAWTIDRAANATGALGLYVPVAISGAGATLAEVRRKPFQKSDDRHLTGGIKFTPSQLRLGQAAGRMTEGVTNTIQTSAVKDTVALTAPGGSTVRPGLGDLLLRVEQATAAYDWDVLVTYQTQAAV